MVDRLVHRSRSLLVKKEKRYMQFLLTKLYTRTRLDDRPENNITFRIEEAAEMVGLSCTDTLPYMLERMMDGMDKKCWIDTPFGNEPLFEKQELREDMCRVTFNPLVVKSVIEYFDQ